MQRTNYIGPADFDRMIDAVPELHVRKWYDVDVQMAFKILYWCALRPSEVAALEPADFDFTRHEVFLGQTKTKIGDSAVIPKLFEPELKTYLKNKEGPILKNCHVHNIYKWCIKLGQICDIRALIIDQSESGEKTKGHLFRKSMAKDMLSGVYGKPASLNVIQRMLRHESVVTTARYLRMDLETVKDYWE